MHTAHFLGKDAPNLLSGVSPLPFNHRHQASVDFKHIKYLPTASSTLAVFLFFDYPHFSCVWFWSISLIKLNSHAQCIKKHPTLTLNSDPHLPGMWKRIWFPWHHSASTWQNWDSEPDLQSTKLLTLLTSVDLSSRPCTSLQQALHSGTMSYWCVYITAHTYKMQDIFGNSFLLWSNSS